MTESRRAAATAAEGASAGESAMPPGAPQESDTRPADALERLHPNATTRWRLASLLRGALFAAAAMAAELVLDPPFPAGLGALVIVVFTLVVAALLPPARFRAWGYRLRESDLYLRHGVFFRTTTIVPHARIQHVDTRHGPVDRILGLADVVVFTAGTRGAVIAIPALGADTAEALRDRLAALSGAGDAV